MCEKCNIYTYLLLQNESTPLVADFKSCFKKHVQSKSQTTHIVKQSFYKFEIRSPLYKKPNMQFASTLSRSMFIA